MRPARARGRRGRCPPAAGLLDAFADPAELPGWLTEADIGYFAGQFTASGFTGGLNWYRNLDRNWELTAPGTVPPSRRPRCSSRASGTG